MVEKEVFEEALGEGGDAEGGKESGMTIRRRPVGGKSEVDYGDV